MKKSLLLILLLLIIPSTFALVFPKEILFFDRLVANNEQTKIIDNEDILFTSIGITTNKDVTRARITVQAMPDCPENAPYQENVLQCFFVTSIFDRNSIIHSEIGFKVPKEWVRVNDFDKIELRRYSYSWNKNNHGIFSEWRILETNLESEDEDYYYYTSYGSGIDYFSIVGNERREEIRNSIPITSYAVKETPKSEQKPIIENPIKNETIVWPYIIAMAFLSLFVSFIPAMNNRAETGNVHLHRLTEYITSSKTSEKETKKRLLDAGWEEWQINLAFNEVNQFK